MLDLAALQSKIRETIISGKPGDERLTALVQEGGIAADQRLQIHRNNFRESLTSALRTLFPGSIAFVGDEFFAACVCEFVAAFPPDRPQLSAYGGDFAAFFESFPPAQKVAYVADLMRLEWAVHESQNAAEFPPLDASEVETALSAATLALSPSARLLASDYPIVSLWMVAGGQLQPEIVHLEGGGEQAVVIRIAGAVQIQPLDRGDHRLLTHLFEASEGAAPLAVSAADLAGLSAEDRAALIRLADRKLFVHAP